MMRNLFFYHPVKKWQIIIVHPAVWMAALLTFTLLFTPTQAQEPSLSDAKLFITAVDTTSAPTIRLRAYGVKPDGQPLDLATQSLVVNHGDQTSTDVSVSEQEIVGTFTIFLVDTPAGVEEQLPAIEEAILQYASPEFMQEAVSAPVDYVAIYQVGAAQAEALLPPAEYHNAIRNFLLDPLPVQDGPTALIDSLMGLLNSVETLKPNPEVFTSIVVFSDGTDAVSTQFQEADVPRTAATLGVPIHTITLNNSNLGVSERGSEYMQQIAIGSGGLNARMSETGNITPIWQRISSFRMQNIVQYVIPQIAGGDFPIVLSLANEPVVQAGTTVSIAPTRPYALLTIPPDSRTITVPDLEDPLTLQIPFEVGWVDGETREVTQIQLIVNEEVVADLNTADLESAAVTIPNLVFGANRLQLAVADANAERVSSGVVNLTVSQGEETIIPEALQATGASRLLQTLIGFFIVVVAGGAVVWLLYTLRSWPPVQQLGLERFFANLSTKPRRQMTASPMTMGQPTAGQPVPPSYQATRQPRLQLQILEAMSDVASPISLNNVEIRLGRATAQNEIAFPNDLSVSRVHASMIREGHSYRVFDEHSTSGTFVNGEPVQEYGTLLIDGDELSLGAVRLRFVQS